MHTRKPFVQEEEVGKEKWQEEQSPVPFTVPASVQAWLSALSWEACLAWQVYFIPQRSLPLAVMPSLPGGCSLSFIPCNFAFRSLNGWIFSDSNEEPFH